MKSPIKSGNSAPVDSETILCTVVTRSHLSFAATMMQSVRKVAPHLRRMIFLCDQPLDRDIGIDLAADIIPSSDVLGDDFNDMAVRYLPLWACGASKPYLFRFLFSRLNAKKILYLDSDTLVFSRFTEAERALQSGAELILTPHITKPFRDAHHPSDHDILKAGVWNTGFLAMQRSPSVKRFLEWWAAKCQTLSLVDFPANLFIEQRWADFAPAFVRRTKVLRHPGYNLAYWNLAHRKLAQGEDGQWRVSGSKPLRIMHFSGFAPNQPDVVSRHQDRFRIDQIGEAGALYAAYAAAVLANGFEETRTIPWAGSRFRSGRHVPDLSRALFRKRFPQSQAARFKSWIDGLDWLESSMDRPDSEFNPRMTALMSEIYRTRADLQAAFDIRQPAGLEGYRRWFLREAAVRYGVDSQSLDAARRLTEASETPA